MEKTGQEGRREQGGEEEEKYFYLPMTKGLGKRRPEGCEHERSGPSRLRPETGSRRVVAEAEAEAEAAVMKV